MKLPKIGAIVVNYNNPLTTRQTLTSLLDHVSPKEFILNIYLVNNGCTDSESPKLGKDFKTVSLIESKQNLGFAGGNNLGINKALSDGCTHLLIINNDVTILSNNFFQSLLISPFDITAPLIEYKSQGKTLHDYGGKVDYLFGRNTHLSIPQESDYFTGACLFIKSEVFKVIKGFDEKYFLYYEDVDFCLRARAKGLYLGLDIGVSVYHLLSASTNKMGPEKLKVLINSHLRFCRNHLPIFCFPFCLLYNIYLRSKRIPSYLHWKWQELLKSIHPLLNRAFCFVNRTPIIHLIGDSHVWSYYYHHPFIVHHLGAATAYNLGNLKSTTGSAVKLKSLLKEIYKDKDVLLFELGEIDCRVHIYNQYRKNNMKQSLRLLISITVKKYLQTLEVLINSGYKVAILSPTPTGTEKNIYKKEFFADFPTRAKITRDFHLKLQSESAKLNIPYINLYSHVVTKKWGIKKEYQADEVHLNSKVVPITLNLLSKQKLYNKNK